MAFRAGKRVEGLANGRLGPRVRVVKVLRALRVFKGLKGFRGLRAGKRQAWTPIGLANGRLGRP